MTRGRFVSRRVAEEQSAQRKTLNELSGCVVDQAVKLHKELGPGLLENVYEAILEKLLMDQGLTVRRQVAVPIEHAGLHFKEGFRADLIVDDRIILEIKAVEQMSKAHQRQLLTYLKLTGMKVGLLLNFGVARMRDGICRVVNQFDE
ncbi:MAG TPA: GxxExxY protein [Wenzhouxiangella sp.]|nr:GxxExxY protein [Wenzhouxiangella sp.]